MARRLRAAGADVLVMACNTAHYYYEDLASTVGGTLVHMPREAAMVLRQLLPGASKAGVLATTGTVLSRVYHRACAEFGLEVVVPSEASQSHLMEAIYGTQGIKAGNLGDKPRETILMVGTELVRAGAEGIILGCTEIPLVVSQRDFSVPVVDATEAAAKAVVREALSISVREG
jgi:aspartate racemase